MEFIKSFKNTIAILLLLLSQPGNGKKIYVIVRNCVPTNKTNGRATQKCKKHAYSNILSIQYLSGLPESWIILPHTILSMGNPCGIAILIINICY